MQAAVRGGAADRPRPLPRPGAFNRKLFAVVGDLNDEPASSATKALVGSSGLEDAITRIRYALQPAIAALLAYWSVPISMR